MFYNLFIKIFNYSVSFGGQERYIKIISNELVNREVDFLFVGTPISLANSFISFDYKNKNKVYVVNVLNGNRALFKRGWFFSNSLKVYIQHSHFKDSQGFFLKRYIRFVLFKILLKRMDIIIRVCNDALPSKLAPEKIFTIYNGVELPNFERRDCINRPFTLLMVGSINENKNQILALNLLKIQSDLNLVLVGDGPKMEEWKEWATINNLNSRVTWTGFVEDPGLYFSQADAFLLLSEFEAFPFVVLEAMSYSLPVISTNVGGVPEAITHNKNGLLLPSRDILSLQNAVKQLTTDPNLCERLGKEARKTVEEKFSKEKMVDDFLSLIVQGARRKGLIL